MFARRNKYKNIRTGGYDSKREAFDALWLRNLQKKGIISDLEQQVRFDFVINGKRMKHYRRVDFRFKRNGKTVWYETKGVRTEGYKIKNELMQLLLGEDEIYLENGSEQDILGI